MSAEPLADLIRAALRAEVPSGVGADDRTAAIDDAIAEAWRDLPVDAETGLYDLDHPLEPDALDAPAVDDFDGGATLDVDYHDDDGF